MNTRPTKPIVLCFSGLDPSGGAGIQADIETIASLGCHCAPIVTTLTVQDTRDVKYHQPVEAALIIAQARAVLEDMPVNAVKLGLLGHVAIVEAIHTLLQDYPHLPVVVDPIIHTSGGTPLADRELLEAIDNLILPYTTLLTPNSEEARLLAPQADCLEACANQLLETGCRHILITGTHENTPQVIHRLWSDNGLLHESTWPRLPNQYHGSGCTLAAALSAYIAHGMDMITTAREALSFTWHSLNSAQRLGMGQHMPERFFWCHTQSNTPPSTLA